MSKFVIGQLVVLKSGGPVMTVKDHTVTPSGKESYHCQWFAGKKLDVGTLPPDSLDEATPKTPKDAQ